jgi:hypothetical protein
VPALTAVPFLAPFPWVRWALALRARLDFDAVIRASPPVVSRLVAIVPCGY